MSAITHMFTGEGSLTEVKNLSDRMKIFITISSRRGSEIPFQRYI